MNNLLPLSDSQRTFIANGLFRAISQDMPEMIYENRLPTNLGSGQFRWNFINRNLTDIFDSEFDSTLVSRGGWKVLLLCDLVTSLSISIMSEANFRKVQRSKSKSIHYLEALISNNKKREPLERQVIMSGFEKQRDESALAVLRNQLLGQFPGIIEEHLLVLFDYVGTEVISVRAVLLTPQMEIAICEDWTQFLHSRYIPKSSLIHVISDDNEEVLARLKPQYDSVNTPIVESESNKNQDGIV